MIVNGSEVIRKGEMIILVMLGPVEIVDEADAETQLRAVKAENQKAIVAIE